MFGRNQYNPSTREGKKLIAHVIQQANDYSKYSKNLSVAKNNLVHEKTSMHTINRACDEGTWQYEYDGCSVPGWLVFLMNASDKDNPAGGEDTHFSNRSRTGPCDKHDECYQTCGSSKAKCDLQMYYDMMKICTKSIDAARCIHFANLYYDGLKKFGGRAFNERQHDSCLCQSTSRLV